MARQSWTGYVTSSKLSHADMIVGCQVLFCAILSLYGKQFCIEDTSFDTAAIMSHHKVGKCKSVCSGIALVLVFCMLVID